MLIMMNRGDYLLCNIHFTIYLYQSVSQKRIIMLIHNIFHIKFIILIAMISYFGIYLLPPSIGIQDDIHNKNCTLKCS